MYRVHAAVATLPAAGTDVYAPDFGDQSAGKVVSAAPAPEGGYEALVVLQTSSAEAGQAHLGAPDGPALAFLPLPYTLG